MSTKDWGFIGYGIVIDNIVANEIAKKINYKIDYAQDLYSDVRDYLYDKGVCDTMGEFTGEAFLVDDKGSVWWGQGEVFHCEQIWYVELNKMPTLFAAPYKNMCEVIDELKNKLGEYLPNDFDYKRQIRLISGTYYG